MKVVTENATIAGPVGRLEAIVDSLGTDPSSVAVVCHPHPQYHGTMHNKVAYTLARFFSRRGSAAIRFNYRGVGASDGTFGEGSGEIDDTVAAIDWAQARWPAVPLYLAGFSFGGMVSLRAAVLRGAAALITVAPAVRYLRAQPVHPACPWLVIQGLKDEVVDPDEVIAWTRSLTPRPILQSIADVGHYFHGSLNQISAAMDSFFKTLNLPESDVIDRRPHVKGAV